VDFVAFGTASQCETSNLLGFAGGCETVFHAFGEWVVRRV